MRTFAFLYYEVYFLRQHAPKIIIAVVDVISHFLQLYVFQFAYFVLFSVSLLCLSCQITCFAKCLRTWQWTNWHSLLVMLI